MSSLEDQEKEPPGNGGHRELPGLGASEAASWEREKLESIVPKILAMRPGLARKRPHLPRPDWHRSVGRAASGGV